MNERYILSIQSHVAYGYVGNKAATYLLQSMGFDVCPINTVQFSNHTGYGKWQGEVFSAQHVANVIDGVIDLGIASKIVAVLSGYIGDSKIGEVIASNVIKLRSYNPGLIYLCDPVMGDVGRGVFVKAGISEFFKNQALQIANVITPNHFEAELLYGSKISTLEEAQKAASFFHEQGVETVVITSFAIDESDPKKIYVFLSHQGKVVIRESNRIAFDIAPNGTGDLFSALFLGYFLKTNDHVKALESAVSKMFEVIEMTYHQQHRELSVLQINFK